MTSGRAASARADVVRTHEEAAALDRPPLLVLEPLEAFLDAAGIGAGRIDAEPIGDGHSNVTYALRRGPLRVVLRRPPRPPLPPSAHDVLREARLLRRLRSAGVRAPDVLAVGEDEEIIGSPFYVMPFLEGHVLSATVPPALDGSRTEIGPALVEALAELHAVDVVAAGLSDFGKATGYLERQVCRFRQLLEHNRIRDLPDLERIADWLAAAMPASRETTVVHGDFRLGNVMFAAKAPPRVVAVLDWELAALGDPLADLGYLTAMWAQRDDPDNPMLDLSAVTRLPGFVDRDVLASSYSERTGRSVDALAWYQVLALWKSAIFLEGSYARFVAGTTDDRYFARLGAGIPQLAAAAWRWAQAA